VIAVKAVFGDHARRLMVSATKSMTGHLLGAAGGFEFGVAVLALMHGIVPPTINLDQPEPNDDLDHVPHHAREAKARVVLSNSFAFGGTYACLVAGAID
jgi:3-oxoacyl-[acyl-carrier-protein] synthase II